MPTSSPRVICPTCQRPEKVCLCQWIQPIDNLVKIGILQHPAEVTQIKGTAKIAALSLQNCRLWIGEDFTQEDTLHDWLAEGHVFILYPETEALDELNTPDDCPETYQIEQTRLQGDMGHLKVLVLDGTWRKTHKMMMKNTFLHRIHRLALNPVIPSSYKIRKQKDSGSLSTLEAIYEVLIQLEQNEEKYLPLIHAFKEMVNQQLAFRKK